MRLQKYLASAGVGSRRKCEEYIVDGRVKVNGKVEFTLGTQVDPAMDEVRFDGHALDFQPKVYILFYKPPHVMCTSSDPEGRETVLDYFKDIKVRIYTVGRLDYDTEGLIILTNDGELANTLTHPRHEVLKQYYAICRGDISRESLDMLRQGVELDGKKTAPSKIKVLKKGETDTHLLVEIREGKNRQVRRMFEAVDHEVVFLRREQIGTLMIGTLKAGQWRHLTEEEVAAIMPK